jgi:hypothetical protein
LLSVLHGPTRRSLGLISLRGLGNTRAHLRNKRGVTAIPRSEIHDNKDLLIVDRGSNLYSFSENIAVVDHLCPGQAEYYSLSTHISRLHHSILNVQTQLYYCIIVHFII